MAFASTKELERARTVGGFESSVVEAKSAASETISSSELLKELPHLPVGFRELLVFAGIESAKFQRNLILNAIGAVFVLLLSLKVSFTLLIFFPLSALIQIQILRKKAFKRADQFERDYTALLVSLASAVKTGLDPLVALSQSDQLFHDSCEVSQAIKTFRLKLEQGCNEEQCIMQFAENINHPDIQLFRSAFNLARKEGSSLSECLHRLAKVTRHRQSFRRKVRAAVAMQKLSAVGIAGCAIIIGIIQYVTNPGALNDSFNHPTGFKFMCAGLSLIVFGLGWMLNMAKSRI